jgi:hypothetical protein
MTKIVNTIIGIILIALIATFIVSAVSLQGKTDTILSAYAARREELAGQQQRIQDMIAALNSTLQSEITRQQAVAAQLGIQTNNTASSPQPPISQPTPTVVTPTPTTPAPQVPAAPAPVVYQPSPRVTRAS